VDANGRIMLSQPLRDYAHLGRKVVLIGQGNKFELWDQERWEKLCQEDDDDEEIPPALMELSL